VNTSGQYFITTFFSNLCPAIDTFNISTKECEKPIKDSISIPNVFTPNGDALNETFKVSSANIEGFRMEIFDRWGLHLATLNSPTEGWDGKYGKGKACTEGTYYYVVVFNFIGKSKEKRSGYLTLLR
jgi:gliding motility-associated-like protein